MDSDVKTLALAMLPLIEAHETKLMGQSMHPASGGIGGTGADSAFKKQIEESQKPWREYAAIAEAVRKLAAG
jgi:hypothetical protein